MTEDWQPGLAATKVQPPAPPRHLVHRSRLDDALDAALDRHVPLVLVSAPAGSGKTTLLAAWLATRSEAVAWLQVEEPDSDPARFWSYLARAIGRTQPALGAELQPVIAGSRGDGDAVVPELVNRLADLGEPLLLVIDDYHLVDDERIHRGVERLVDLCPPQVTVVLATRMDPPFRIGRLRVRNQVAEVRADDLRFVPEEAAGLLGDTTSPLAPELLAELCGRTEGWAAGLVLAGLSLQRADDPQSFVAAFRGDDHLVVEYLRDELLTGLADDDHRRLLETSVLDELSGELVDAVTGTHGGAEWLRETARSNQLLVALDRTGTWFRYHRLLRDLLHLEAEASMPDHLPELHRRAATWFEAADDHGRAIAHRLAADDLDGAARLLHVLGPRLLRAGQVETLSGLLTRLGEVARADVGCAVLAGWCAFLGGRYAETEQWLGVVLGLEPAGFPASTSLRINLSLATGDVTGALDVARAVLPACLRDGGPAELATAVGAAHGWAGMVDEARAALEVAAAGADATHNRSAQTVSLVHRCVAELEHSAPAVAHRAAQVAIDTAERFGLAGYHGVAPAFAVRARTADDEAPARDDVAFALASARRSSTPLAFGFVLALCGDTLLDLGDDAGAVLLDEAHSVLDRCPDPGIAGRHLARAEARHGTPTSRPAPAAGLVEQLTDRELAVLRYLPSGLSQRDIARELYVSINTVRTHCRAIYRKLGVGDRRAAVQAARDHRLL
ncbi:LuxR C-terminal-related transcriptional regulator [Salinilacustrithrix flava]|uniref:LuxR C-terminal-related transcriptional regulator n=1 Tax=Salinilacustrithrix flava TaxID=2957203 RepID=UPI003D7C1695